MIREFSPLCFKTLAAVAIGCALLLAPTFPANAGSSPTAANEMQPDAKHDIEIVDITGRKVTLSHPASRVVLGDARHIMELAMLLDDPVAHIAGWRQDKSLDPARYRLFAEKFPAIDDIATVGAGNRQLSVENVIALQPDVVILSLLDAENPATEVQLQQLSEAGIPVIFVDFFSHPIENTEPSMAILGQLFAAEQKATELIEFYNAHLDVIRDRIAQANPERPRVFIQVHATPQRCCASVGSGVFHDFIQAAGGYNLGQDNVPGIMGNIGLENLIALDPDFFLATGGVHLRDRGGLVIGAGVSQDETDRSFAQLLSAPGIAELRAVKSGQVLGIWHLFNDSPMHIALIEELAKRFHPRLFADLDPAATLHDMQARFSPIASDGVWWSDAPAEVE